MTKPVHATCEHCKQLFSVKYIEAQHPKGIKETYFKCTNCNHKYFCFATDDWVRMMHKKMKRIRETGKGREKLVEMQDQVNARMARLKSELMAHGPEAT